ncbi:SH3 domain-containing protein [Salipiger sp. H15]|uniref:SH3 domain-containing protein n=1 Tax=Alloyangia sp. H15 TaxID=3029062 RepID=A0AAU8AP49_9RHOB
MRKTIWAAISLATLAACGGEPGAVALGHRYEVQGVEEGDFLKLRGGPGTGFDTYVGLPNGTVVRVRECTQTGGTRWCRVALDRAPDLTGYVSWAYLREL